MLIAALREPQHAPSKLKALAPILVSWATNDQVSEQAAQRKSSSMLFQAFANFLGSSKTPTAARQQLVSTVIAS